MYIVKRTEEQLWTVGEAGSNGRFEPTSDHDSRQEAEDKATRLNGGTPNRDFAALKTTVNALLKRIDELEQRIDRIENPSEYDALMLKEMANRR